MEGIHRSCWLEGIPAVVFSLRQIMLSFSRTACSKDRCWDFVMLRSVLTLWLCHTGKDLHANPYAFSNYAALDSVNGDYWFKALSWLPEDKPMVLWDAYASMGREGEQSLLRVLLHYPALRVAWWLVLAVAVFYVLFRAKRRQRPIPVVRPPENGMLEFVRTVSQLYFKQKEHAVMARKQIEFFLGEVRAVWHLPTDRLDGNFARLLAEAAGVEEERANELVRLMETVRETPKVTEFTLRRLMDLTDVFVRKMIDN